ncbi:MAG: crotonase/enoyl-CoA hydratase family protein [Stappiaceae bacterium]
MNFQTLRIDRDQRGVATLSLCRPEKHNALSSQMIEELTEAATMLGQDEAVRVVVLTGEGKSFCAGADLSWMKEQFDATREQRMTEARKLANLLRTLNELVKPLIGRIQGQAFGGGIGLMCVCDSTVVASGAKFGLTETRLGLIPATISPYVIARMGEGKARRVFMSARLFGAEEAQALDLCAVVASAADLDKLTEQEVRPYLSASPIAVAEAKALARSLGPRIDELVIEETVVRLADTWETTAAREGLRAFFDKRKPDWVAV